MYSIVSYNSGVVEFANGTSLSVKSLPNAESNSDVVVASSDRAKPHDIDYNADLLRTASRTDTGGSFGIPADSCNYVCPRGGQTVCVCMRCQSGAWAHGVGVAIPHEHFPTLLEKFLNVSFQNYGSISKITVWSTPMGRIKLRCLRNKMSWEDVEI